MVVVPCEGESVEGRRVNSGSNGSGSRVAGVSGGSASNHGEESVTVGIRRRPKLVAAGESGKVGHGDVGEETKQQCLCRCKVKLSLGLSIRFSSADRRIYERGNGKYSTGCDIGPLKGWVANSRFRLLVGLALIRRV